MFIRTGVFLLLTLIFTFVLGGVQQETGLLADQVILPQLGPGLAGLVMLLVLLAFRKDATPPNLSPRPLASKAMLFAILFPVGAALATFIIVTQIAHMLDIAAISMADSPASLIGMVIGAVGEELGWRGYLHKMLDRRLAGWVSSLIVGVPWALWHVGLYQNGPIYMAFIVILITSYAFVLYFIVKRIGFNLWIAAVFHLMINVTNVVFLSILNQTNFIIVNALTWAVIAGIVLLTNRSLFFVPPPPPPSASPEP